MPRNVSSSQLRPYARKYIYMHFLNSVNGRGNRFCLQSGNLSSFNTRSPMVYLEWDPGGAQDWSGHDDDECIGRDERSSPVEVHQNCNFILPRTKVAVDLLKYCSNPIFICSVILSST